MTGDVIEERSAGVIIYRVDDKGKYLYLVLKYAGGHWDFAKGKKEQGETDIETALREVREETGINDVEICKGFEREIEYEFMEDGGNMIHKSVIFFLGRTLTKEIVLSDEHQEYIWHKYDDASFLVTYPSARDILASADMILNEDMN